MQHAIDCTPYEGRVVMGWPMLTMRRGEIVMRDGSGRYLPRAVYDLIRPRGRPLNGSVPDRR
jgi:dihydropyrimidinase